MRDDVVRLDVEPPVGERLVDVDQPARLAVADDGVGVDGVEGAHVGPPLYVLLVDDRGCVNVESA